MAERERDTLSVLVLNGPNLGRLELRPSAVYGEKSWTEIAAEVSWEAKRLGVTVSFAQADGEGELIGILQKERSGQDGAVINPGGLSHTSVALRDAIEAFSKPVIEVHLSNVGAREPFRHPAITGGAASGVISGLGALGYRLALVALVDMLGRARP